jgi:hypothetical protein
MTGLLQAMALHAQLAQVGEDVGRPAEDVVLHDVTAHALDTDAALGPRHLEAQVDGFSHAGDVVGIDQERIAEFAGRASEFAEDEHAVFVGTGGEILLGHQVHAVMERGDEADIGDTVPAVDFLMSALALNQDDGTPASGLEALVDALGGLLDLLAQVLVALDACSRAGRRRGQAFRNLR